MRHIDPASRAPGVHRHIPPHLAPGRSRRYDVVRTKSVSMTRIVYFCLAACLLTGCTGAEVDRDLGMARDSPDEFTVTTRAPLQIPARFTLPPPVPGAPRPQEPSSALAAEAALDPAVELQAQVATASPGQDALVAAAGPPAPAGIRQQIEAQQARLNNRAGIGSTLAFWQKAPTPGRIIDPEQESARLRKAGVPTMSTQ